MKEFNFRSVTTKFGFSESTAWTCLRRFVRALYRFRNFIIQWPNQEERRRTANAINERFGYPDAMGAVDGTHIRCSPPKAYRRDYINRKKDTSMQLQVCKNIYIDGIKTQMIWSNPTKYLNIITAFQSINIHFLSLFTSIFRK